MKQPLIIALTLICSATFGQNLVPNPSFEEYSECPNNPGQIERSSSWYSPTTGSSDYFNSCFTTGGFNMNVPNNALGYQEALTGEAYAGLILFENAGVIIYREYLQSKLTQTLVPNQVYFYSINVTLADSSMFTMRDIGIHFSSDSLLSSNFENLPVTPQIAYSGSAYFNDTAWLHISGQYVATGTEAFMTIGFFEDNSSIDTVFTYYSSDVINYDHSYVYIDDVCVSVDSAACGQTLGLSDIPQNDHLKIYPNPATDAFSIETTNFLSNITVFDMYGRLVIQTNGRKQKRIDIDTDGLSTGVYNVVLIDVTGQRQTRRILKK